MEDDWNVWSKHVLKEIERLNNCYIALDLKIDSTADKIKKCLNNNKIEIAKLKIKSGVWGLIGGMIPVAIMLTVYLLKEWSTK